MKKPRTDQVEISLNEGTFGRFVGPRTRLRLIRTLLRELDFKQISNNAEAGIPWREVVKDEIAKFGEPALVLRGVRAREEMSQSELARRLKIPQSNLSKMENGTRPISKKMAVKLAEILRTDYRVFL